MDTPFLANDSADQLQADSRSKIPAIRRVAARLLAHPEELQRTREYNNWFAQVMRRQAGGTPAGAGPPTVKSALPATQPMAAPAEAR